MLIMVENAVNANTKVTAQILLDGAQEILGKETVQQLIERISPRGLPAGDRSSLQDAGPFLQALEETYGAPGGRGLALRIGRAAFRYGLKYFGDRAGFRTMEFRLLPAPKRVGSGLQTLAHVVAEETGSQIVVTDEGDHWRWQMRRGRGNEGRRSAGQSCFLIAGLLQEFSAWAGGGRFYQVTETECQSTGSRACVYRIEKKPLD